jgi:hypothetical protein
MNNIRNWRFASLRCVSQWQEKARVARRFHPVFYYIWCVLGTPFWAVACLGYVCCLLVFPSFALGFGLAIVRHEPGAGWLAYAAAFALFWTAVLVYQVAVVVHQLRSRIVDIEAIVTVVFISLSFLLASWYIPHSIGQVP